MKKVICAVAAFAMVAGVATVASAKVSLSGDARARWVMNDFGENAGDFYTKWDSRFRVVVKASTESGVYGKARLRFLDGNFDGTGLYAPDGKGAGNIWSDYAYAGFKKGAIDVRAGRQPTNFSKWFDWDERADRVQVAYRSGGTFVAYTYDQMTETLGANDDNYEHGVTFEQKFSDSMSLGIRGVYVKDDKLDDRDGIMGSAYLRMNFGGNNVLVEQAWVQGDVAAANGDNQYGGYASWNASFGSVSPTVMLGYTKNGFLVDNDFGWIMIGGAWGITEVDQVGEGGDTIFVGATADMDMSEDLSLQGNLVYMNIDQPADELDGLLELSGKINYEVVQNTDLSFKLGYLRALDRNCGGSTAPECLDKVINGVVRMDVKF